MAIDPEKERAVELSTKLLETLNKLLSTGNWEESLFLRNAKKRIDALRDEAQKLLDEMQDSPISGEETKSTTQTLAKDYIRAYIFLFQTQSNNLQVWRQVLKSLVQYGINRPVYLNEEHIRELIRGKPDIMKYGYAIVAIKKEDILVTTTPKKDQLGHEIVTLKEGTIKLPNILGFVHGNSLLYIMQEDSLVQVN